LRTARVEVGDSRTEQWLIHGIFGLSGAKKWNPDIDQWLADQESELGSIAQARISRLRECGDDVRELMHDGCPHACVSDAAFAYVNVFKAHVNLDFFCGSELPDASNLLEGAGKRMRHVKLRPGHEIDERHLMQLIADAYIDIKTSVCVGDTRTS
jgi:hypothetical protein